MNPTQILVGVYLAGAAGGFLALKRLMDLRGDTEKQKGPAPADPFARDLAAMLPAMSPTRQDLQKQLWLAGYYRPSALTEYLAIRAVLVIGALLGTACVALTVEPGRMPTVLLVGIMVTGLGFSIPRIVLGVQATSRARRIVRALPLAMDVVGLCLTAGQNLLNSLQQTSRELRRSCPDMAEELYIVQQQARMHSLEQALLHWADRIDISEVRSLALLLVQSDRLGTDMVDTLLDAADSQRTELRQKAEAQANRANFWILFPTLFCLWIAAAIVLVGPVYVEFWRFRREQMDTLVRGAKGQVERTTPAKTAEGATDTVSPGETPTSPGETPARSSPIFRTPPKAK